MPGLLAQLDLELGNFDVGAMLGGVIGQVGDLDASVGSLTGGPGVVGEIIDALGNPPQPEGLDGVANFTVNVTGALSLIPTDTSGPLAPLLEPFQNLTGGVNIGVSVTGLAAAFDAIRTLVELTTGRVFGGPATMPDGDPPGETIDLARIQATLDQVETQIDQLGDMIDPSRLIAILQQFGTGAQDLHSRWPRMPVTADMFEALDLLGKWEAMSPAQLTEHLAVTLDGSAQFIALPRTRVVQPVLDATSAAAGAGATLARARAELQPILSAIPGRLAAGDRVGGIELRTITERLAELEALAQVLDLDDSPLAEIERLPRKLEREMMRVLRIVNPAINRATLEQHVRGVVARIPAADPDPLGDIVDAIAQLDLSAITDPLTAVREAVQDAVDTAHAALDTVREGLTQLLQPLSDGIGDLVEAIGLDRLQAALGELPEMIETFMNDEIMTRLTSLKADVEGAVDTVSGAVDTFDPAAIKADIEAMVRQVASVLQNEDVRNVFAGAQAVVGEIVDALEGFPADLRAAADQSVQLLDQVREVAAAIPSELIPDAAKPTLQTAVDAIADLDITGTVGQPLADVVETAIEQGAVPILDEFEGLLGELRTRLEGFRPSQLISDDINQPFEDLFAKLREFQPSDLLDQIADALADLRGQIHVVEPEQLLRPLLDLHADLRAALEAVDPVKLLEPVEDAIQDAIRSLLETTGFEDVFGGVQEFFTELDGWVDLLDHAHDALERLSQRLEQPVAVDAQLDALTASAVAAVTAVDMAALGDPLARGRLAAESIDPHRLAAELAPALRRGTAAADALVGADATGLIAAIRELPSPSALQVYSPELAGLGQRLTAVAGALEAAVDPWHALAPRLGTMAGRLEAELRGYTLLATIEGRHALAEFLAPPTEAAALAEQVGDALRESMRLPVATIAALVEALAPHVAGFTRDLGRLLGALHQKFDAITGEDGLLGTVNALDDCVDLLRNFDLSPITDPLRTEVYEPLLGVVDAIDPEPLRAILQAVKDALEQLLDLANLFDRSTIDQLDATYAEAVDKLAEFSPRTLLVDTLDPVYEELLAEILPLFDLVTRLREAVERAGDEIPPEIVAQLGRVEVAFDALLHALPLQPSGGPSISASASVSVSSG